MVLYGIELQSFGKEVKKPLKAERSTMRCLIENVKNFVGNSHQRMISMTEALNLAYIIRYREMMKGEIPVKGSESSC